MPIRHFVRVFAKLDSIQIGRLPTRIIIHGKKQFAISAGDAWLSETIPHYHFDQMRLEDPDATIESIPIEDDCFLATRSGHGTWGHWLGEILPLVAVAERNLSGTIPLRLDFLWR